MVRVRRGPTSASSLLSPRAGPAPDYDDLERRRKALHDRLAEIDARVRAHPGYRSARRLLDQQFRRSSVVQRATVLDAAAWLIEVLETLAPLI